MYQHWRQKVSDLLGLRGDYLNSNIFFSKSRTKTRDVVHQLLLVSNKYELLSMFLQIQVSD